LPPAIAGQLAEGGRLVAVWSAAAGIGQGTARLSLKAGGRLSSRPLFDAAAPHLPGFARRQAFVFPA
jgi:protein-L-isoaspartate(D-aspartate) O-methyltransferase